MIDTTAVKIVEFYYEKLEDPCLEEPIISGFGVLETGEQFMFDVSLSFSVEVLRNTEFTETEMNELRLSINDTLIEQGITPNLLNAE